jgi:hypothetical protein
MRHLLSNAIVSSALSLASHNLDPGTIISYLHFD